MRKFIEDGQKRNGLDVDLIETKEGDKIRTERYLKNNKLHGSFRVYWNGVLLKEQYFYNDNEFGVWKWYKCTGENIGQLERVTKYILYKFNQLQENGFFKVQTMSFGIWRGVKPNYDHPPMNDITRDYFAYYGYDGEVSGIEDYFLGPRRGFNYQKYYDEVIKPFEEKFKK